MGPSSTTYVSRKGHTYTAMFYSLGILADATVSETAPTGRRRAIASSGRRDFHPTPTPAWVFLFSPIFSVYLQFSFPFRTLFEVQN